MNYVDGDPANSSEDDQGAQAAGGGRSGGRGGRRQPGLLHVEVLPASALPARRPDRIAAAGLEAAVGQGRLKFVWVSQLTDLAHYTGEHAQRGASQTIVSSKLVQAMSTRRGHMDADHQGNGDRRHGRLDHGRHGCQTRPSNVWPELRRLQGGSVSASQRSLHANVQASSITELRRHRSIELLCSHQGKARRRRPYLSVRKAGDKPLEYFKIELERRAGSPRSARQQRRR